MRAPLGRRRTPGGDPRLRSEPLIGSVLPRVVLPAWPGGEVNLRKRWSEGSLLLSTYPGISNRTGGPERHLARLRSWDRRGAELAALGYDVAFLCAQTLAEQRRWTTEMPAGFTLVSDVGLELARGWPIAVVEREGHRGYEELTLVLHGGEVNRVFYASREPRNDVDNVLAELRRVHGR